MKKMSQSIRKTIAVLLSIVFSSTVAFGSMPTMAYAALDEDDEITLVFAIGDEGAAYNNDIAGYTFDDEAYTYTATSVVTETSEGAEVTLLAEPDTLPGGKQFVGWQSTDGQWIEGSTVKLSALASAEDEGNYRFTAVYNDYTINYDLDGGKISGTSAGLFLNPDDVSFARAGFDEEAKDTYTPLTADSIAAMKSGYSEFVGWALNGNTSNMVENFADYDFDTYGDVFNLQAIYGSPIDIGAIAYCNAFDGLGEIDELSDISEEDLIVVEDGVSAYTVETGEISPVPNVDSTPRGQEFASWDVYAVSDMTTKLGDGVTSFDTTDQTADLVFVASFADAEYGIEYLDPDGEEFSPALTGVTTRYTYDDANDVEITLPEIQSDAPDETHVYAWYDGENYYAGGATYSIAADTVGNITFTETAIEVYDVSYVLDGGTAPTVANPLTWKIIDGDVSLNEPTYEGDVYVFDGWYLASSTEFVDPENPITEEITALTSNLFEAVDGEVTLVASWSAVDRTITLTGLSGIDDDSIAALGQDGLGFEFDDNDNPTSATIAKTIDDALTIPAISKDGYRFIKWDDGDTETEDSSTVVLEEGDITDDLSYAAVFDQEYTLTLTRLGGITDESIGALETAGFTVNNGTATQKFIGSDDAVTLPEVEKPNYDFIGWYLSGQSETTASKDVTFNPGSEQNARYVARFVKSYTVTFMDGDEELTDLGFTYLTGAESITLPALPAITGYTSLGWTLLGNDDILTANATLDLFDIGINDAEDETNLVFIAQYEITEYTVTLTGLDGIDDDSIAALGEGGAGFEFDDDENPTTATITKTIEDTLTIPAISKGNHRFMKWDDSNTETPDGKTIIMSAGTIQGDLSYAAVFEQEYTLTLSGLTGIDDDSVAALEDAGFTVNGDGTATLIFIDDDASFDLPSVAREDYEYLGWYVTGASADTASTSVTFDPSSADDADYTAKLIRAYTVTFMDGETELTALGFTYLTGAESITLPAVPDKPGYTTGGGWFLQGDETTTTPFAAGTLTLESIGITSDEAEAALVFVADEYTTNDYTITLTGLSGIDDDSIAALGEDGLGFEFDDDDNPTTATITKTVEDTLTIPAISKDGFRFMKWDDNDTETEDSTTVVFGDNSIVDDFSYAAVFEQEYTLTLAGLDGISEASATALEEAGFTVGEDGTATLIFIDDDDDFTLPTVAKDDYDFLGWYAGTDATAASTDVTFEPSSAADATYTASFIRSYTVTFMDNGTELTDIGFTYQTGVTYITLPALPTKTGYATNGWLLRGDETVTLYSAGTLTLSAIGIENADDERNLVFNAKYTIISRTITLTGLSGIDDDSIAALGTGEGGAGFEFDDNNDPTYATVSKTIADTLTVPAITKLHKVFDGWQKGTDDPVNTITLAAGDITGDFSYAATFSNAKAITVNFDLDGGAFQAADITGWDTFGYAASTSETITAYADDDFTAIAEIPVPVKDDYVFTGWTVGTSTDKVMSYSLPTPDDQTIALTATWVAGTEGETVVETEGNAAATIDAGTVSDIKDALDENVGTGETSVTKLFIEEDLAGAHDGSTLEGKADEAFDGATAATITKTYVDIDITQYITSDTENSTAHDIHDLGRVVDIAYTPTSGVANLKAVVREHDGTPKTYTRFRQLTAAPTTLEDGTYFIDDPVVHIYTRFFSTYALGYATGVYKVTFDVNGGNETYDDVYTDQLGTLPTPTKSGDYTFQKWTYADNSTATAGDTITADTTLTAQWTYTGGGGGGGGGGGVTPPPTPPTTDYTITFNADGGVAVTSITVTDGKLPTLPVTTKEGSTFDGWFYADGSKAAAGDAISSDITLKAGWTLNGTFTVYFDADGGKAVESITVTDGKLPELPTTTKDKNTFNGWFYASGTKAVAGDPMTENVTLKASWTPDETPATFTVTFDSKGGSAVSSISVSDAKLPTLPTSTRDKYTLDGWFYADGTQAKAGDAITADTILTAKWTKVKEPAPTEIVPTKNGVVVAVNSDGAKTVTLIDGSKYGKKATINTVVGTDKQKYKVTRIYDEAFKGNATITKVVIGANVLAIGDNAFEDCTGLKTVTFGKNLATIGDYAFDGCTSLTAAKLGNSVKTIGNSAFDGCTSLKTLSIGTGVTSIGVDAFNGCTSLATLTIGMADIPDGLFAGYTSLTKVSMGKTVKTIGDSAFEGCTSLKTASLGSKVERIGDSAFQNDGKVKSIKIGANVKSIGDYAFAECVSLKSAVLGKTVATVGDYAFSGCTSMTTTTIGKAVATLGDGVYAGNAKLGTVKVNSTNLTKSEAVGDNFLSGIKATATIKITKSVFDQTKAVFEEKSGAGAQVKYRK